SLGSRKGDRHASLGCRFLRHRHHRGDLRFRRHCHRSRGHRQGALRGVPDRLLHLPHHGAGGRRPRPTLTPRPSNPERKDRIDEEQGDREVVGMKAHVESDSAGPLLLLGKPRESLHLLFRPLRTRRCMVARTTGEDAVETMASLLKPTAVLLEASDLYLEGRTILSRLKGREGGFRVIFFDVEGPWALFMEHESEHTNDLRVQPCAVDTVGETLMEIIESGFPGSTFDDESL